MVKVSPKADSLTAGLYLAQRVSLTVNGALFVPVFLVMPRRPSLDLLQVGIVTGHKHLAHDTAIAIQLV